ncbi:MAG: hypothetical protein E7001_08345 [Coriobacteriaceae bacterium]|nr:hypothetical protein [Coriobacteriaceae bacterium]
MGIVILVLAFICFGLLLSLVFSAFGLVFGLVMRALPLILLVGAAVFFAQGGKVHIDWPESWRRR